MSATAVSTTAEDMRATIIREKQYRLAQQRTLPPRQPRHLRKHPHTSYAVRGPLTANPLSEWSQDP